MQQDLPFVQRWKDHRSSYRPRGEPIDASKYGVEEIDEPTARAFVTRHHYSASYPADRARVGLFRAGDGLVGVAVFSTPCNVATTQRWLGLDCSEGTELGRFVLLDDVPANGETWFLRRAFDVLRRVKGAVRGVLSMSDPVPRTTDDGDVVMPGHVGMIYQAYNGRYRGRASPATIILDRAGRCVSARALSKIRNGEQGAAYAIARLVAAGAPSPRPLEDPRAYVRRALAEGPFRRFRHPGNHVYVWPLDRRLRLPAGDAYPKGLSSPLT